MRWAAAPAVILVVLAVSTRANYETSESSLRMQHMEKLDAATGRYRRSAKGVASGATGATKRGSAWPSSAGAAASAAFKAIKLSNASSEEDDQLDSSFEGLHGRRIGTPTDHDQDEYDEDHGVKSPDRYGKNKKKTGDVKLRTNMEMEEKNFEEMYGRRGAMKKSYRKSLTENEPGVMDEMEGVYGRRDGTLTAGSLGAAAAAAAAMAAAQFEYDEMEEDSFEGLHGRRIGTPTRTDYDEEDDDYERYRHPSQRGYTGFPRNSNSNDSDKKSSSKDNDQDCALKGLEKTLRLPDDPEKVKLYIARVLQRLQQVLLQGTKRNA